jgi:hypothetical protein
MIKIHLTNSAHILNFHYDNITVKKGKEWTIFTYLNNRITQTNGKPNQVRLTQMYNHLITKIRKDINGFSILTANPKQLEDFKIDFERLYRNELNSIYKPRTSPNGKDILYRDDLLSVFYYSSYHKWKAYELAKKININVCPYCNRSYTFILGDDFNKGTRFEYDHFFDKASHPYLALSFYNLVPSCHICNSNLKGSDKFGLTSNIHPYLEGFSENIVFSIKPKNVEFLNGNNSAYRIKFKKGKLSTWDNAKIKSAFKNISVFCLSELYNMHKDYVNEIIQKSIIYNEDHIKELFNKYNGTLFSSEDDVKRMVLGNYINEDEYSKRPLSKLTADISRELGILK